MIHVSCTDLQRNLARYLDAAGQTQAPILVTRRGGKGGIVVVAGAESTAWQETVHLLSSPRDAVRVLRAMRQADAGELTAPDLLPNVICCRMPLRRDRPLRR